MKPELQKRDSSQTKRRNIILLIPTVVKEIWARYECNLFKSHLNMLVSSGVGQRGREDNLTREDSIPELF